MPLWKHPSHRAVRGGLWNCPLGAKPIGLLAAPPDLVLQADCRKRLLMVRQADHSLDTSWQVKPDGTFHLYVDFPVPVSLSRDVAREGSCHVMATLELSGKLDCNDADRVRYQVDTIWNLDATLPLPSDRLTGSPRCQLPLGCYLHATSEVRQCD